MDDGVRGVNDCRRRDILFVSSTVGVTMFLGGCLSWFDKGRGEVYGVHHYGGGCKN